MNESPILRFPAAFYGECDTCGDEIDVDDEIGYLPSDDRASCATCIDAHEGPFNGEEWQCPPSAST